MAATVAIAENNGTAPGVETASIANCYMGSVDAQITDASAYPITAGTNSYEKWQRFRVSAAGGSSKITMLKIWASAGLATGATLYTNASHTKQGYFSPSSDRGGYTTPVATSSTAATYAIPISQPASANVGIGGSVWQSGANGVYINCATVPSSSDYFVMQIKTSNDATAGTTVTMNYQYDEVA